MWVTFTNFGDYNRIIFLTFPLYEISNPNIFINLWCRFLDNALVRTSATMCFVGDYSNQTSPFSTHSQTKWCYTSMCFVHAWQVRFLVNDITPWLSYRITITFFSSMYPKSIINFVIHMASFVACVFAMYSASMVGNAIVGCHLSLQEMVPLPIMKTNLVVDLLSSRSPPQSHHNIQAFPWMVLHQIVISFAMYLTNIERFVW